MIRDMKDSYPHISLVRFCRLLGVTRQAHYQNGWQAQATSVEHELVLQQVHAIRRAHKRMGGRKLYELLDPFMLEHGIKMGRDALFDLLADHRCSNKGKYKSEFHHISHGLVYGTKCGAVGRPQCRVACDDPLHTVSSFHRTRQPGCLPQTQGYALQSGPGTSDRGK